MKKREVKIEEKKEKIVQHLKSYVVVCICEIVVVLSGVMCLASIYRDNDKLEAYRKAREECDKQRELWQDSTITAKFTIIGKIENNKELVLKRASRPYIGYIYNHKNVKSSVFVSKKVGDSYWLTGSEQTIDQLMEGNYTTRPQMKVDCPGVGWSIAFIVIFGIWTLVICPLGSKEEVYSDSDFIINPKYRTKYFLTPLRLSWFISAGILAWWWFI